MTIEQLTEALHISPDDPLEKVYEKLFCAALLRQGTYLTAKVLQDYNAMKRILYGAIG